MRAPPRATRIWARRPGEDQPVELGNLVLDKDLIDARGRRAGKVDDVVLDVAGPGPDGVIPPPTVEAIVSGPFAFAGRLPDVLQVVMRWLYSALGVREPRPVIIPWDEIVAIDVVVHVRFDREQAGLLKLQEAVERRIIGRLPGAYSGFEED